VCVCVCIIYIYIYIYIYVCVCVCIYIYIYMCVYIYIYMYMYNYIQGSPNERCLFPQVVGPSDQLVRRHIDIHMCIYIYTCIYIYGKREREIWVQTDNTYIGLNPTPPLIDRWLDRVISWCADKRPSFADTIPNKETLSTKELVDAAMANNTVRMLYR